MPFKSKILLIYTGGTIGMILDNTTNSLKAFDFELLLQKIPELSLLDCQIETISFQCPIDSSTINTENWKEIAEIIAKNYDFFDGFVVLHGSDTMSYSASALSFMLKNLSKPVIFTGSQLPIGDLRTDAKENLITAIEIASLRNNNKALIGEVCVYFEYKLFRGNRTTKINAENFKAFMSPNYPTLVESGVNLNPNPENFFIFSSSKQLKIETNFDTNVMVLKLFPGINETVLKSILNIPNLKGIVLETYGTGNAPIDKWFLELLKKAINDGIKIINVSQCAIGSVRMGNYETSTILKEIGLISGKDITTEAAVTKLMFLLGKKTTSRNFKNKFENSIRGEMTT